MVPVVWLLEVHGQHREDESPICAREVHLNPSSFSDTIAVELLDHRAPLHSMSNSSLVSQGPSHPPHAMSRSCCLRLTRGSLCHSPSLSPPLSGAMPPRSADESVKPG